VSCRLFQIVINWIEHLIGGWGTNRKLTLVVKVDHIELTSTHLIIGLQIDWHNQTDQPIPVKEVQVRVYLDGRKGEPLRFYPLERFVRAPSERAFQKKPVRPFTLPSKKVFTEQLRFLSQEVLDIPAGDYGVEIEIKDISDISHTCRTHIQLETKKKYRRDEEWHQD